MSVVLFSSCSPSCLPRFFVQSSPLIFQTGWPVLPNRILRQQKRGSLLLELDRMARTSKQNASASEKEEDCCWSWAWVCPSAGSESCCPWFWFFRTWVVQVLVASWVPLSLFDFPSAVSESVGRLRMYVSEWVSISVTVSASTPGVIWRELPRPNSC